VNQKQPDDLSGFSIEQTKAVGIESALVLLVFLGLTKIFLSFNNSIIRLSIPIPLFKLRDGWVVQ
jgi:hypothetical protein